MFGIGKQKPKKPVKMVTVKLGHPVKVGKKPKGVKRTK